MPNRILKESICTSESLVGLSAEAEVLFYRLIVKADDFGLFYGAPKLIASLLYPLNVPEEEMVSKWLCELVEAGLVRLYQAEDGKHYLQLVTWEKHQNRRASKSKFPLPKPSREYRAEKADPEPNTESDGNPFSDEKEPDTMPYITPEDCAPQNAESGEKMHPQEKSGERKENAREFPSAPDASAGNEILQQDPSEASASSQKDTDGIMNPHASASNCMQSHANASNCGQMYADASNCLQLRANAPVNVNVNVNDTRGTRNDTRETKTNNDTRKTLSCAKSEESVGWFERFWHAYPRKCGKKDAEKAWKQLKPTPELAGDILRGLERWRSSAQWKREGGQYIPYPATFLRGERWKDSVPESHPRAPAGSFDTGEFFDAALRRSLKEAKA